MIDMKFFDRKKIGYPIIAQSALIAVLLMAIFSGIWTQKQTTDEDNSADSAKQSGEESGYIIKDVKEPVLKEISYSELDLNADSVLVLDLNSQKVLFAKDPDKVAPIASITKLMTALLVQELVDSGTTITVSKEAVKQYGESGLRVGEKISAKNLTEYALLSSSNDAAYALAYSLGEDILPDSGSAAFVDAMNIRAKELGLNDTHFQNPTGLDISIIETGAMSTAADVTTLLAYLVNNHPDLLKSTTKDLSLIYNNDGEYHESENTNPLVSSISNLIASKTGYTDLAGGNLTIAFDAGFNRPIIVTVLGSTYTGRFKDVQKLVQATKWQIVYNKN